MSDPERFGRQFRQNQHEQGQHAGGDRDTCVAVQAITEQGRQLRDDYVGEIVAEQYQADEAIWLFEQAHDPLRALVPLFGKVRQTVAVYAHEGCFRAGKEGRDEQ